MRVVPLRSMPGFVGRVKNFNDEKGFGFIRDPNGGEQDLFVHRTSLSGNAQLLVRDQVSSAHLCTRIGIRHWNVPCVTPDGLFASRR